MATSIHRDNCYYVSIRHRRTPQDFLKVAAREHRGSPDESASVMLPVFQTKAGSDNTLAKVAVTFVSAALPRLNSPPVFVDDGLILLPAPRRTGICEPHMETFFSSTRTRMATPLLRKASTALLKSVFVNAKIHTSREEEADKMCRRRRYMDVFLP